MTEAGVQAIGTHQGRPVLSCTLRSPAGVTVEILNYGALIRDWRVPVPGGGLRPVVLGFDRFEEYPAHSPYFGAIAGRVANRIRGGRFTLNGRSHQLPCNNGPNHLHGGPEGIGKRLWQIAPDPDGQGVRLTHDSPDGEMGYPGEARIAVHYRLSGHRLDIALDATVSAPTPISLVQHSYFNLMGAGDILDHRLWLAAGAYTPVDEGFIPTGAILSVAGTPFDFRRPRSMRDAAGAPVAIDHNLVLDTGRAAADPAAVLVAPDDSLRLRLFTDRPGLQVYNGWKLALPVPGLDGHSYPRFGGICLEDQAFPDAVNNPHFPSVICTPHAPYRHRCAIEIC